MGKPSPDAKGGGQPGPGCWVVVTEMRHSRHSPAQLGSGGAAACQGVQGLHMQGHVLGISCVPWQAQAFCEQTPVCPVQDLL